MSVRLSIEPVKRDLPTCSPDLMPFHIDYSGPAPISTYMCIKPAKSNVGAPAESSHTAEDCTNHASAPQTNDAAGNNAECSQKAENNTSQPSQNASMPDTETRMLDAPKRFVSTFRGREIHGVDITLPEGYTGLILRAEDKAVGGKSCHPSKDRDRYEGKTRFKRVTRRTKTLVATDENGDVELEMSEKVVRDVEMVDMTENENIYGNGFEDEDENLPKRVLVPSAQFSSLRLWNPDFPADAGVDEYARSLTEWITLAHHIHHVPP